MSVAPQAGGQQQQSQRPPRPTMVARPIGVAVALGLMAAAIWWVEASFPIGTPLDHIFRWSFVIFSVGFAELFISFVVLTILGRIDLARAFEDKDGTGSAPEPPVDGGARPYFASMRGRGAVSLSRLQAFLWTLVIVTSYFYKVASRPSDGLPSIPAELLLVMGISGAVYLAGKQTSVTANPPANPPPGNPPDNPPPGQ
jgi:hypothetical protein